MTTAEAGPRNTRSLLAAGHVRMYFAARAARFRLAQPRPVDRPRLARVGLNPIRILITGAGLAAGYGVNSHADTIAGPVLDRVASHTGRGVTIDINASGLLPARNAIEHIGLVGSHTYDIVIFAPCYLEAAFAPGAGIPRHGAAIQQHLVNTGSPTLHVIMLGIPQPTSDTPLDNAAAAAAESANRVLRDAARTSPRVQYVRPTDFTSVRDPHPFTAGYYATVGHQIADHLLSALDRPAR